MGLIWGRSRGTTAESVLSAVSKSQAIIEFDPAGNIINANENFLSVMGYEAGELAGKHHRMFLDPAYADSAEYAAFWGKLRRGEFDAAEYKRLGRGGREVWIQATYNPIFSPSGELVRVVKFATDITSAKMKAAENAGKLAAISRAQAVIEFTIEGDILTANENFLAAVGYEQAEIVGRHHRMFVEPAYGQSADYADFWRRLGDGDFIAQEFKRIGKGGREVWIQASYNPIFDPDDRVMKVVKFATDITGRVRAVTEIGAGLGRVAAGDLACEITEPFISSLERLRVDFNNSVSILRDALQSVGDNAASIDASAAEISAAANDLSMRTEKQAASVEETAAALEQITATVKSSAQRAEEAGTLVERARGNAVQSEAVVHEAIATMGKIESSSHEVGNIIGLIDEIAFQTNLLALNAGVEAARAGETGRGFAVVAQEVRALAQRSTEAAKQIKDLITKSAQEVRSGVDLVDQTGRALQAIIGDVKDISGNVLAIVDAAREQATALSEVNTAIGVIDQGTQHNAAMVEQSSAASQNLVNDAVALNKLLSRFHLGDTHDGAQSGESGRSNLADTGRSERGGSVRASVAQSPRWPITYKKAGSAALAVGLEAESAHSWEDF